MITEKLTTVAAITTTKDKKYFTSIQKDVFELTIILKTFMDGKFDFTILEKPEHEPGNVFPILGYVEHSMREQKAVWEKAMSIDLIEWFKVAHVHLYKVFESITYVREFCYKNKTYNKYLNKMIVTLSDELELGSGFNKILKELKDQPKPGA